MLERLERVETKIDRLGGKVESVEAKVDRMESRLGGLDTRLARLEVQFERLGDDFRTLAGNVGGKFDAILREFAEARKDSSVRFTDHENVMKDHGRRISALERDRRQ